MPEPRVTALGLVREFGQGTAAVTAVRHATCMIDPGDLIALTGPSGSGKSTLLHLLGGLDQPTRGEVSWPAIGSRAQLRPGPVVDIFQGPSLLAELTAVDNVSLPLLLAGAGHDEAADAARQSLRMFDVEGLAENLPSELSGGQAQRVAIARALAGAPMVILADEPTGQLDSRTAADVLQRMLARVRDLGASLLVSTHDPNVARMLDRQWTMVDGRLETDESDIPGTRAPGIPPAFVTPERGTLR